MEHHIPALLRLCERVCVENTGGVSRLILQHISLPPCSYNGGRSAEDIIKFINDKARTRAGQKKAPSAVVELDTSNFDTVVMDDSKDVLVEFYAPCELDLRLRTKGLGLGLGVGLGLGLCLGIGLGLGLGLGLGQS